MPEGVKYQILRADKAGCPAIPDMTFTDPAEAADTARKLSKVMGEKLMVKPIVNPQWRRREKLRIQRGEYRKLPWWADGWWRTDTAYAIWKDQFPHPSIERPGWLAYTKSPEDGSLDKQTIVRPGAYLKKYFEHVMRIHGLSERRLVDMFMMAYGPLDIKFASTEDEIISVYEKGPQTCMVGRDWPGDGRNPAYIYAAGDLQVAYLGSLDHATARAVVWPEKKIYSRVYGDIARITQGLNRMGYQWGAPIGAKVKKVQVKEVKFDPTRGPPAGCFIAPYIDKRNERGGGHLSIIDKGDHMLICEEGKPGSHHCGLPDGHSGLYVPREDEYPTFTCENCGTPGFRELIPVIQDPETEDEISWCNKCVKKYAFQCNWSARWYPRENVETVKVDGYPWCKYYAEMYAAKCEMTGDLHHEQNLTIVYFGDKPKKICHSWIENNGGAFTSMFTNRVYMRNERATIRSNRHGGRYASKSELKYHAFQCDGCQDHYSIAERNISDDKLFCDNCTQPGLSLNQKILAQQQIYGSGLATPTAVDFKIRF